MRTIKFRGKASNGEWVYGSLTQGEAHNKKGAPFMVSHIAPSIPVASEDGFELLKMDRVDPETVGQFTGLHDANGVEIYEGDLLLSHENSEVFEVVYDAPRFCFKDNDFGFRFLNRPENFGVVGNIHDDKGRLENN